MIDLTERQSEILTYIATHIQLRHYPPTVREIGRHFGIESPNGVMCHLKALVKKGVLCRDPKIARGLWIPEPEPQLPFGGEVA